MLNQGALQFQEVKEQHGKAQQELVLREVAILVRLGVRELRQVRSLG